MGAILSFLNTYWIGVVVGIPLLLILFYVIFIMKKKNKGTITEKIRWSREGMRELDGLLADLEKYFKKIEKKLNMSYITKDD